MTPESNLVEAQVAETLRRLYWERHLTVREIAEQVPMSRRLVREILLKLGPLRPARIHRVFWSGPFSGDEREKAYLMGLRAGDVNVFRESRLKVIARVSTTHQAMIELFSQTFAPYGQCTTQPRKAFLTGYDWQVKAKLDNSFEFMIGKPLEVPKDRLLFYEFLAGLSDSDGSWCLFEDKGRTACAFVISSQNKHLLLQVKKTLEKECFHAYLYLDRRKGTHKTLKGVSQTREITLTKDSWRLDIHRREEVKMLARRILPLSHHLEKIHKMLLILDETKESWEVMAPHVAELKADMRRQTMKTIQAAEIEYKALHSAAGEGGRRLDR